MKPKVHPSRPVPAALRPKIKERLDELAQRQIIAPVTEPTEWAGSSKAEQDQNLSRP